MSEKHEATEKNENGLQPITYDVNGETVELSRTIVRKYLVSGDSSKVTDQEVVMFMQLARFQHLNPFLNEAYLVKFGNNPASIIVSKEAFMKRANANPHYRGIEAGIMVARGKEIVKLDGAVKLPEDKLIGGWATVKRDDREDTHVELAFDEFSKGQATWKNMPNNMIRKSAIVNALREAFPEQLGDMYTEDDKRPDDTTRVNIKGEVEDVSQPKTINDLFAKAPEKPEPADKNQDPFKNNLKTKDGETNGDERTDEAEQAELFKAIDAE